MTMSYRLDAETGIVEILGPQGADGLQRLLRALLINPAYRPGFAFLRDRRGMEAPATGELLRFVAVMGQFPELAWSRWAYVATDGPNIEALRTAAEFARSRGLELEVFPDESAARAWLAERRPTEEGG